MKKLFFAAVLLAACAVSVFPQAGARRLVLGILPFVGGTVGGTAGGGETIATLFLLDENIFCHISVTLSEINNPTMNGGVCTLRIQ